MKYILDHTETPCEKAWEARKERKIKIAAAEMHSDDEEDGLLPFTDAFEKEEGKTGAFLAGALTSYAIQDNPLYADAFEHLQDPKYRSEYGWKMEAKRVQMKTPRGENSPTVAEIVAQLREAAAAAGGEDEHEAKVAGDDGGAGEQKEDAEEAGRENGGAEAGLEAGDVEAPKIPEPPKGEKGETYERKAPELLTGALPPLNRKSGKMPELPPLDTKALGLNP